jgi:hypothetical protein
MRIAAQASSCGTIFSGVRGAALAAALVLVSVACGADPGPKRLTGAVPSTPEELLAELKAHKDRVDVATQDMIQRIDTFNGSRKEGERTIQFSEIFSEDLNQAQRDILNQMVADEKDVSYRTLLERIIADLDQIRGLQEKIARLEQRLTDKYVVAKAGDTHGGLAMDYLRDDAGLDEAKAKEILAGVDRTDELVPGNKVWFAYDADQGTFRTYVTQGDAKMTPLALRRAQKRELVTERDKALATVAELEQIKAGLESDIAALSRRRADLESANASLEARNATLQSNVTRLSGDLAFKENSVFYHVANTRDLQDQKVLSPVLKRVQDVKGIRFDAALDLRQATKITLYPGRFGLEKIDQIRVLPSIYQEGRDFKVEVSEEAGTATVFFLDSEIFRGKEILLAVSG